MTQASTNLTCEIARDRKIRNHHITTANLQRKFTGDHCKALLIVGDSPFLISRRFYCSLDKWWYRKIFDHPVRFQQETAELEHFGTDAPLRGGGAI